MKLFRRIAALALAVAVIAMLGISASAASFRKLDIFGDFGAGAIFEGNLTSTTIRANATFIPNYQDNVLRYQRIQLSCTAMDNYGNLIIVNEEQLPLIPNYGGNYFEVNGTLSSGLHFAAATYCYDAYYIANGVVDCFLYGGPVTLTHP